MKKEKNNNIDELVEGEKKDEQSEKIYVDRAEFDELKELVRAIGDKARLDRFDDSKKKNIKPLYKVSTIDGKLVVGWKKVKDDVYADPISGRIIVNQMYQFLLADGSTKEVAGYNNFADMQYANQMEAEFVTKTIDENGSVVLSLMTKDGRKIEINEIFVN